MIRQLLERWSLPDVPCPRCGGLAWFIQRDLYAVRGLSMRKIGHAAVCANCNQAAVLRSGTAITPGWASQAKEETIVAPGAILGVLPRREPRPIDAAKADEDMPWKRKI